MHDFADFPLEKFYDISTQQHQLVSPCKLSEQNFENFTIRGRFCKKCSKKFLVLPQDLRLHAIITPQWLHIASNSLPNGPSTGCLVSVFTVRITSKSFLWDVCCTTPERYLPIYPNFRQLHCPILGIKANSTLQCWCCLVSDIFKKSRLNWKLKVSNTADNAGIT